MNFVGQILDKPYAIVGFLTRARDFLRELGRSPYEVDIIHDPGQAIGLLPSHRYRSVWFIGEVPGPRERFMWIRRQADLVFDVESYAWEREDAKEGA